VSRCPHDRPVWDHRITRPSIKSLMACIARLVPNGIRLIWRNLNRRYSRQCKALLANSSRSLAPHRQMPADSSPALTHRVRRATNTALVPPKANEFDMMICIPELARAWFGT
jgi:hypothetical protein